MTRRRERYGIGGLALALVAALGVPGASAETPAGSGERLAGGRSVTLVTGDRVLLRGSRVVSVDPGPGRDGVQFRTYDDRGDTYVVPIDAETLVASGRVDRRLFNVSKLVEHGYDDRSREDLPLIVTGGGQVRINGAETTRDLPSVGGAAVRADKASVADFWKSVRSPGQRSSTSRIYLDGPVRATLDQSVPQVGAPAAWQAGHTGRDTKVAVLDTGIDAAHADLAGAVVDAKDFTESESGTRDVVGHGTHVASIVTGSGAASGGRYAGVAPDTTLLNGKVLGDFGGGSESGVLAGMEWAAERGADVVNMSLGSGFPGDGTDVLEQAVNRLTAQTGSLFVVSAGNSGADEAVGSPAAADAALAVGAVDKSDQLARFSSRGPRPGDGAIKPDITAPGVGIVAARAEGSEIGEPVGTNYVRLSGTSMAAPHVAGAAAILAGQHPDWDADELKAVLMGSARAAADLTIYQQGAGRVDVARAVRQPVRADVASLSLGTARWPHHDDQPITRTVTYHNDGAEPITLDLVIDIRDPRGAPAPAGMFVLSATRLTVPARGGASVGLAADTKVTAPDGVYGGSIVATAGSTTVRVPVGVNREVESYDVRLSALDHQGQPAEDCYGRFVGIDLGKAFFPSGSCGAGTVRLPRGDYYFDGAVGKIISWDPFELLFTWFFEPTISVTDDLSLTFDARDGRQVGLSTDQPKAEVGSGVVGSLRDTTWGGEASTGTLLLTGNFDGLFVRPSRSEAPGRHLFFVEGDLAEPDGKGGFVGSPYNYHLHWSDDARVPAQLERRFRDRDLAEVRTRIAAQTPGEIVDKDYLATTPVPGEIVERYSPGVRFYGGIQQWKDRENFDISWSQSAAPRAFSKGRRVVDRWNIGPFGPAFPDDGFPDSVREGDDLDIELPLYSDQFPGHDGFSVVDSGSTRLLRDGVLVGETEDPGYGDFRVPSEPGTYRLEVTADRSNSPFSTRQSAAWTFKSEHVDGEDVEQPLSLMAVRFAPKLDDLNRAPAGVPYAVPLYVQRQAGGSYGSLTSLSVRVSYDDGATWHRAPVIGSGLHRVALLSHPGNAEFVSLRATATDSTGNKVEQTVIRAYQLRK